MAINTSAELSDEQLAFLQKLLNDELRKVNGNIDQLEAQTEATSKCSHLDAVDLASQIAAQRAAHSVLESQRQQLSEIERAMARLKVGTYGLCEQTGEPIGFERLAVLPWARHTVT
ncbi:TraR/DksA family transcriptional regulator [Shewanella woodyi]|uniref:Transcriptional regulator, TraR/DksA family n=1 Tax=Shewanella woodyi (strain ATCC 51908 / MS32) TaxID=392500 RepID=B1KG10_SHEWM|nr:TraR/DksA family transcriptional regulator [Shewanella woodyi]ACA86717.1 transcriptional regulator, TraR/DksA family [Shewanella woodyi ATCC 51908]